MATFALPVATITVTAPLPVIPTVTSPAATPAGQAPVYEVRAVENDGTIRASYPTAIVRRIRWRLNEPDYASFAIPIGATNVSELPLPEAATSPYREVQIYRNGDLLFWGIPVKRRADSTSRLYEYEARGVDWPITKRHVGQADRFNYLDNPGADVGITGWTEGGDGVDTFAVSTTRWLDDGHSFQLAHGTPGEDSFVYQRQIINSTGVGLALFLTCWFWIDNDFQGFPYDARIFSISRIRNSELLEFKAFRHQSTNERETWTRGQIIVHMPPLVSEVIEVRMYASEGTTYFDALSLTVEESAAFIPENAPDGNDWDQVEIVHEMVRYAQGKGKWGQWQGRPTGKSDLNIGVAGANSGVKLERVYQAFNHQKLWTASTRGSGVLDEFPARDNGVDYATVVTPTTRTWTTYFPRKGSTRHELPFRTGKNILSWEIQEDLERCANEVVILGSFGQGASREEGGYVNRSSLGGLTLELVEAAPTDTSVDALDSVANARGERLDTVITVPAFTIPAEYRDPQTGDVTVYIGDLVTGDVHPVWIVDGDVGVNADHRIVELDFDGQAETIRVAVNEDTDIGS